MAGTTQGSMSGEGPADFQRCLELASTGNYQDELFSTLTALISYYLPRAELRRAHELLDSLSARITRDRPWRYPAIASSLGSVVWLEGDFTAAREHLLRALADRSAADPRVLETAWWVAVDPISSAHIFLALTHMVCGDLDRANAELAESVRRCDGLGFPQNAHNRAHTYFMEIWVRLESGQIPEAAVRIAELRRHSEQSGLDLWRWVGATEHATVKALAALGADADAATLMARAEKVARHVDGSRHIQLNSLSDVSRRGHRPPADRRGPAGAGTRTIGDGAAARRRDGNALPRRRADAAARSHLHRTAGTPQRPGRRARVRTPPRRDPVRITLSGRLFRPCSVTAIGPNSPTLSAAFRRRSLAGIRTGTKDSLMTCGRE